VHGVTEATLKPDGNVPSVNDSVARRAINGANRSTDDLITDVGMLSITDDLAGMLRINLLIIKCDKQCRCSLTSCSGHFLRTPKYSNLDNV